MFKLELIDLRLIANENGDTIEVYLLTDEDLITNKWEGAKLSKSDINSMNQIIRLTKTNLLNSSSLEEDVFCTNLDLHTTGNLYVHSSVLASYETLSNFKMDTIIKHIIVQANYNELIFDSSMAGFDCLDVPRRSFQRIDFLVTDSYGETINFQNSHWSMSIIFQRKG